MAARARVDVADAAILLLLLLSLVAVAHSCRDLEEEPTTVAVEVPYELAPPKSTVIDDAVPSNRRRDGLLRDISLQLVGDGSERSNKESMAAVAEMDQDVKEEESKIEIEVYYYTYVHANEVH